MMELTVSGMNCSPCVRAVTNAIQSVDSAASVEIDLGTKLIVIKSDADLDRIKAAIQNAGYNVDRQSA